jgi:hypothetical protein
MFYRLYDLYDRLKFIAYFGDAGSDLFITFSVGKILTMHV